MLGLLALPSIPAAATGLAYLFCYGGFEGPIDWAMGTLTHGSRDHRTIALTFDDGPDPVTTPAVLDVLAARNVHATFFVVGDRVARYPDLTARIVAEGHQLGNHTYSHRYLPLTRSRTVTDELARTDEAIFRATGTTTRIARPPWGGRSPRNVSAIHRAGKQVVLWDVNSYDWKGRPPSEVTARVVDRTRPGSIVLFHDVCPLTPHTVAAVIDELTAARDLHPVTVDELTAARA